jgi:hypothetical protein
MSHLRPFTFAELYALFFSWFLTGNSLFPHLPKPDFVLTELLQRTIVFLVQMMFLFFLIKGLNPFRRSDNKFPALHITLFLFSVPLLLVGLSMGGFQNGYIERSAFILLPFFYFALARGLFDFKGFFMVTTSIIFVVAFNVATLASYFYNNDKWTVYKPNPDWRAAAGFFKSELKAGSGEIFVFATSRAAELTYYDPRFREYREQDIRRFVNGKLYKLQQAFGESSYIFTFLASRISRYTEVITADADKPQLTVYYDAYEKHIADISSNTNGRIFYLVHNRYWSAGFDTLIQDISKDPRFSLLSIQFSFKGLQIYKFIARSNV